MGEPLRAEKRRPKGKNRPTTPMNDKQQTADDQYTWIDTPAPCPECGSLELWQAPAGDPTGLTPPRWRCQRCDPPLASILGKEADAIEFNKSQDSHHRSKETAPSSEAQRDDGAEVAEASREQT